MRAGQRGFSLLEVLVASALTIGVILVTTSAVANSLHVSASSDRHMALNDDALSALTDVRAVSAYDPVMFASLAGRTSTMTRTQSGGAVETITVSIAAVVGGPGLRATATASEGGLSVSQTQNLYLEAPSPGSSVNAL